MSAPCAFSDRPNAKMPPCFEKLQRLAFLDLASFVAHPDRSEPKDGDLPGVPVLQPVKAEDLGELTDPPGVPSRESGAP